jgi:hypothetical protein
MFGFHYRFQFLVKVLVLLRGTVFSNTGVTFGVTTGSSFFRHFLCHHQHVTTGVNFSYHFPRHFCPLIAPAFVYHRYCRDTTNDNFLRHIKTQYR